MLFHWHKTKIFPLYFLCVFFLKNKEKRKSKCQHVCETCFLLLDLGMWKLLATLKYEWKRGLILLEARGAEQLKRFLHIIKQHQKLSQLKNFLLNLRKAWSLFHNVFVAHSDFLVQNKSCKYRYQHCTTFVAINKLWCVSDKSIYYFKHKNNFIKKQTRVRSFTLALFVIKYFICLYCDVTHVHNFFSLYFVKTVCTVYHSTLSRNSPTNTLMISKFVSTRTHEFQKLAWFHFWTANSGGKVVHLFKHKTN